MLKLLLAAAAFCICMAAGRVAAEKYKLRQKTLCGFLSDLKVLEAALKYERTDVKSLALLLAARGSLREFWRIMSDEIRANIMRYKNALDREIYNNRHNVYTSKKEELKRALLEERNRLLNIQSEELGDKPKSR